MLEVFMSFSKDFGLFPNLSDRLKSAVDKNLVEFNEKAKMFMTFWLTVRGMRFELTHPFGRYHLKVVRLPVSPPPQPGL